MTEVGLCQSCPHMGSAMWGAGNRSPNMGQGFVSTQPGAEQPFLECSNNSLQHWIATRDKPFSIHCQHLNCFRSCLLRQNRVCFIFFYF